MVYTVDHIYEVEIFGQDYDFEHDEWVEESRECISQNCYDTHKAAANAVQRITPNSAVKLEKRSGCNGLDIVIVERTFVNDDESDWNIVGEAEWIGACCNGIWV